MAFIKVSMMLDTKIPKNIFQSWSSHILHPDIQSRIDRMKQMNPYYTYQLYTDDEIDAFVNKHYKGEIADCYNRLNIIVAKVDFWRYLVLYKYGGVYLDMDSSIEKPLDELIGNTDEAIITVEGNPNTFVQWGLIFNKGHSILKRTIDYIVNNIKNNSYPNDILNMTGPRVYTRAICDIHSEIYNESVFNTTISNITDIVYTNNVTSYRIFGVDYNEYFCFKHPESHLLYNNKKCWRQEQNEKPLLL